MLVYKMKMVADAVQVEPVSAAKFPANREKNREFRKIVASRAPEIRNNGLGTGLLTQIPYSTEQGIMLPEQGILTIEQGVLLTRAEVIIGWDISILRLVQGQFCTAAIEAAHVRFGSLADILVVTFDVRFTPES